MVRVAGLRDGVFCMGGGGFLYGVFGITFVAKMLDRS